MIRVIYTIRLDPHDLDAFLPAWRQIVRAHADHGALGSVLLRGDQPDRLLAISRWRSRDHWQPHRTDDAHPEAYATFRRVAEVLDRQVFDEIEALEGAAI